MKRIRYLRNALLFLSLFLTGCIPTVTISSPQNGESFESGEEINFSGSAIDFVDGELSGASIVWTSSIDGEIGTGIQFAINTLSEGTHTITLTATNSNGEKGKASISITIEEGTTTTSVDPQPTEDVLIPGGTLEMGCQDDECKDDELPVHTVYLDAYYIDKYEVTHDQYAQFLNNNGNKCGGDECLIYRNGNECIHLYAPDCQVRHSDGFYTVDPGYEDHPVKEVSWCGAKAFCEWVGKRLPTEAEWENAARGGLVGKKYPWGDSEPDCSYANFKHENESCVGDSMPVGSYEPNEYGLYDMAGNEWEWVNDFYDAEYYSKSSSSNPTGPESGSFKVIRGGSWEKGAWSLRCSFRDKYERGAPRVPSGNTFRCARTP